MQVVFSSSCSVFVPKLRIFERKQSELVYFFAESKYHRYMSQTTPSYVFALFTRNKTSYMDKKTMHNSVESPKKILILPTIRKIPIEWTEIIGIG